MHCSKVCFLVVLILASHGLFGQNNHCSSFKTGTFKLLGANSPNYIITRNDTIQLEWAEKSLVKTDFYIRWIDDCTYELTLKKMHNRPVALKLPESPIKLFVHINKVSGDTCWVETRSNNSDYISKKRMVKISNAFRDYKSPGNNKNK